MNARDRESHVHGSVRDGIQSLRSKSDFLIALRLILVLHCDEIIVYLYRIRYVITRTCRSGPVQSPKSKGTEQTAGHLNGKSDGKPPLLDPHFNGVRHCYLL
jgi:hypothetical protein